MSTSLPAVASKANSDAGTDDPKQSLLTDLASLVDRYNELRLALGSAARLDPVMSGLQLLGQAAGTPDKLRLWLPSKTIASADADKNLDEEDRGKTIVATGSTAFTITLSASATLSEGWYAWLRNDSDKLITLDPNSAETIDGATTLGMLPGEAFLLVCTGATPAAFRTFGRGGRARWPIVAKAAGFTLSETEWQYTLNCNGTFAVTLPAASAVGNGFVTMVANVGVGAVTLDPAGAELIDGAATKVMSSASSLLLVCDGAAWRTYGAGGGLPAASQAEMEAATSNTVAATPGTVKFHPGVAKWWCVVDFSGGVATMVASYNVTSYTRIQAGRHTVTINVDFSSINHVVIGGARTTGGNWPMDVFDETVGASRTAGAVNIRINRGAAGTAEDPDTIYLVGFGDQ